MNTGRLVIERALESAEVRDAITKPPSAVWRALSDLESQAVWAQEDEAGVADGGGEGGVKFTGEEGDEEQTVEEGSGRRRGRAEAEDL